MKITFNVASNAIALPFHIWYSVVNHDGGKDWKITVSFFFLHIGFESNSWRLGSATNAY